MSLCPACKQESDSAEQLMAAFGKAATLIQHSEYVRCRAEQGGQTHDDADVALQEDAIGVSDVDADSLAAAKQVQAELHKAMHAALSTSNGFLIIPTIPGPPIHQRYVWPVLHQQQQSRVHYVDTGFTQFFGTATHS